MARFFEWPFRPIACEAKHRAVLLIVVLVVALIGAPATSALRNECSVCPRTCPMHHAHSKPDAHQPHLKCHAGAAASHHQQTSDHTRGPAFSRTSCGNHGLITAIVLPPMILPSARPLPTLAAARAAPGLDATRYARHSEPPDTPPPIGAALSGPKTV